MSDAGRAFRRAWATGAGLATVLFVGVLTNGFGDPFRRVSLNGNFYEAQARALLHGRLALQPRTLGIEGFVHDGRTYTYFPPFPALLRLPVVAATTALDARLGAVSMTAAFVVALVGAGVLVRRVRTLVRGDVPLGRLEWIATAAFALAIGAGSPLMFTAGRPWVYHEASLWALALALCAFDQVVALLDRPGAGRLVRAGAFATLATLSRFTVGAGPALALGLVLAVVVVTRLAPRTRVLRRWFGVPDALRPSPRVVAGLAVAAAVPLAAYAVVNTAKFGRLFAVPIDSQVQNLLDPHRRRVLAANGGSLFSLRALPTQALALLRPDGIRLSGVFPWIRFPTARPTVVGDVAFDRRDHVASLTTTLPVFVLLGIGGVVGLARRPALRRLLPAVVGAVVVLPLTFTILYVAQRYTGDVFPVVLLCAVAGFAAAPTWPVARARGWTRAAVTALVVLTLWGAAAQTALAVEYQRSLAPLVDADLRRGFADWQLRAGGLPLLSGPVVERGTSLPGRAPRDHLFVLGDCDALYAADGHEWHLVEGRPAGGRTRLAVTNARRPAGTVDPLLRGGTPAAPFTLAVEHLGKGRGRFVVPERGVVGLDFRLHPGRSEVYEVTVDPRLGRVTVTRDLRSLLRADDPATTARLRPTPEGPTGFSGAVRVLPVTTPVCRAAVASMR